MYTYKLYSRPFSSLVGLLQSVLHLLRVGGGSVDGGLVQILENLVQVLSSLTGGHLLQLDAGLLSLGHQRAHLGLELLLVLLRVGHQLGVLRLNVADGVGDLGLDLSNHIVEGSRVLLGLLSQIADDRLQLGGVSLGVITDQGDQLAVVLDAPQFQERGVHLAERFLEAAEQLRQGRWGGSRSIADNAASRSLGIDKIRSVRRQSTGINLKYNLH